MNVSQVMLSIRPFGLKPYGEQNSGINYRKPFAHDTVTFGYSLPFKNSNLTCFTCGGKLMTSKMFAKIKAHDLSGSAKEALNFLSKYKRYLRRAEKDCFGIMQKEAAINPNINLQQILQKIYPSHIELLQKTQLKVINKVNTFSSQLPHEMGLKLKKINKSAREIILNEKIDKGNFKRKVWVDNIYNLVENLENRDLADQIYQIAESFPSSHNNAHAFIVKYSRRSSQEIGERLYSETPVSIDHLDPHGLGGASHWSNYAPKDRGCNSTEGRTSMYRRAQAAPQMAKNVQKGMDRIIGLINAGKRRMDGFYDYPKTIADKYREGTKIPGTGKSLINIDISHLKSKEWVEGQQNKRKLFLQQWKFNRQNQRLNK